MTDLAHTAVITVFGMRSMLDELMQDPFSRDFVSNYRVNFTDIKLFKLLPLLEPHFKPLLNEDDFVSTPFTENYGINAWNILSGLKELFRSNAAERRRLAQFLGYSEVGRQIPALLIINPADLQHLTHDAVTLHLGNDGMRTLEDYSDPNYLSNEPALYRKLLDKTSSQEVPAELTLTPQWLSALKLPELEPTDSVLIPIFIEQLQSGQTQLIPMDTALEHFAVQPFDLRRYMQSEYGENRELLQLLSTLPGSLRFVGCNAVIPLESYSSLIEVFLQVQYAWPLPGPIYEGEPPEVSSLDEFLLVDVAAGAEGPDTLIGLEGLLQFDWKLTVGDKTLSDEDFEILRKNAGKIVKLHDSFVRADPAAIKRHQENQARRDRMSRHLIMLATLTGSYQTSKVQVTKRLKQLRSEIFAGIDTDLPSGLQGTLRHYQQYGYIWLTRNLQSGLGSILADDMGLGKTIQLIALLLKLKERDELKDHPALIVVPNAVLINWQRELAHFAPSLKVNAYHGYARSHENLTAHDIVLTTYGTLRTSCKKLNGLTYRLIAADEAQNLKNHNAQTVKALKSLKGQSYIALTGTPVENRLAEYWSIMDFVNPGLLGNLTSFQREISSPIERHRDPLAIDRFQRITGPFILRRLKTDRNIIADLPDKFTKDEYCELTPAQASLYQAVLDSIMGRFAASMTCMPSSAAL